MRLTIFIITSFIAVVFSSVNALEVGDIEAPAGFQRTAKSADSFASYLRKLPISTTKDIELWDGSFLPRDQDSTFAVVTLPLLFDEDLEQCADFTMRFWAEYLQGIEQLHKLALYDFYGKKRPYSESSKSFRDYLKWHMRYSNSFSVKRGANKVALYFDAQPGDMYVQNDSDESIGHISMILDEAQAQGGHKVYLVGYSFMPAQQFRVEEASDEYGLQGWFTADGYRRYAQSVFGSFGKVNLMRY